MQILLVQLNKRKTIWSIYNVSEMNQLNVKCHQQNLISRSFKTSLENLIAFSIYVFLLFILFLPTVGHKFSVAELRIQSYLLNL